MFWASDWLINDLIKGFSVSVNGGKSMKQEVRSYLSNYLILWPRARWMDFCRNTSHTLFLRAKCYSTYRSTCSLVHPPLTVALLPLSSSSLRFWGALPQYTQYNESGCSADLKVSCNEGYWPSGLLRKCGKCGRKKIWIILMLKI